MRFFWWIVTLAGFLGIIFPEQIAGLYIDTEGPMRDVGELIVFATSLLMTLIAIAVFDISDRLNKR